MVNFIKCFSLYLMTCASFIITALEDPGTTLYEFSDVDRKWTDTEAVNLQCRMIVGSLVPTKVPVNSDSFLMYFDLIKNVSENKMGSMASKKRTMLMVADAIGGYLYSKLLPTEKMLYYNGKSKIITMQKLNNLMEKIKYVLNTDGRGWMRPTMATTPGERENDGGGGGDPVTKVAADETAERCGGVDAGPYGLLARRNGDVADVPFFDSDRRPHSLVVPWQPGRAVLYGLRDTGCHRALYDHCARAASSGKRRARALHEWVDAAVEPRVTPAACAAGRWYPALWGASLAARNLRAAAGVRAKPPIRPAPRRPRHELFAAVVLLSVVAVWTAFVFARHVGPLVQGCPCSLLDCVRCADEFVAVG